MKEIFNKLKTLMTNNGITIKDIAISLIFLAVAIFILVASTELTGNVLLIVISIFGFTFVTITLFVIKYILQKRKNKKK